MKRVGRFHGRGGDRWTGRTALVTGASSGIGAAFAREFAARGADLVLVARSEAKLRELAGELTERHGVEVEVVVQDLSVPGGAKRLVEKVSELGLGVDVLVNNAGFGAHGDVASFPEPARLGEMVQFNVAAPVELTAAYLPAMVALGWGAVINVASTAGFQPIPHMAVYGATKAFVLSFTEALWQETRGTGVRVVAICPGPTDTGFFDVVGTEAAASGPKRTSEQVVATTLRALGAGRPSVVDGRLNGIVAFATRLAPRRLNLAIAERVVRET